jgi:hypothetical protein
VISRRVDFPPDKQPLTRGYQKTIDAIRGDAEARRKRELEKAHQQAKTEPLSHSRTVCEDSVPIVGSDA